MKHTAEGRFSRTVIAMMQWDGSEIVSCCLPNPFVYAAQFAENWLLFVFSRRQKGIASVRHPSLSTASDIQETRN